MIFNKGQIGTGFTAPAVFIIILFIMGLFALISAGEFKIIKKVSDTAPIDSSAQLPNYYTPLFAMLPVSIYDTSKQTRSYALMRLIDIYSLPTSLQVDVNVLTNSLVQLSNNTKSCLLFYANAYPVKSSNPFTDINPVSGRVIKYSNGIARVVEGDEKIKMYNYYLSNNLLETTAFTSKVNSNEYVFIYYYGGCLDG